jgi:hypothetical protein
MRRPLVLSIAAFAALFMSGNGVGAAAQSRPGPRDLPPNVTLLVEPSAPALQRSEFFVPRGNWEKAGRPGAPLWVSQLDGIGRYGKSALTRGRSGYAPAVYGQSGDGNTYSFGVAVALTRKDSSVRIQLIDRWERVIRSATLTSPTPLFWQAELGDFVSGVADYPSRLEIDVLSGRALAFLTLGKRDAGRPTILPLVPTGNARDGSLSKGLGPYGGGYAYFSNGPFDCCNFTYYYSVYGAPANTYGTLHVTRNGGSDEVTPGWMLSDGSGNATKGPWNANINETATNIYIEWTDSTRTAGGDFHVNDYSMPELTLYSGIQTGSGAPIPGSFFGNATDATWGTGFVEGYAGYTVVRAAFYDSTTHQYYSVSNGTYSAGGTVSNDTWVYGGISPNAGSNVAWVIPASGLPPSSAHNSTDNYEWTVQINDRFYYNYLTAYFYGPR